MKYLITSDIHGSYFFMKKILSAFHNENADALIIMGDLYYHGPRNPLPKGYAPIKVAKLLNGIKDKLFVISGNCDSEVDQMISDFNISHDDLILSQSGKTFYFTHGHKINEDALPCVPFDFLIYGHFHKAFIKEKNGKVFASGGSPALPKDKTRGYLLLDEKTLELKNLKGKIISEIGI